MKLFYQTITKSGREKPSAQMLFSVKRFRKHFASLHRQDKKLFIFPNTPQNQVSLPSGFGICRSVAEFRIKNLKGGFQRRPELIANRDIESPLDLEQSLDGLTPSDIYNLRFDKIQRIQQELVHKAVCLSCDIKLTSENNGINIEKMIKNEKNTLVLDIGCGVGTSIKPLLDMGYSCIGVDLDLHSLSEFQKHQWKRSQWLQNHEKHDVKVFRCFEDHSRITDSGADSLKGQESDDDKLSYSCSQNSRSLHQKAQDCPNGFADVVRWDLRHGLPFRPCSFDMAVSISFLQWLFFGERHRQLHLFFSSLKSLLRPSGKAVIQFYPRSASQLNDAVHHAMKHFQGVLVGDYPHVDRGRKLFLVMFN